MRAMRLPVRIRSATLGLLALLFPVFANGAAQSADTSIEYAVKAAFIYKFVPYVDWPSGVFATAATPLTVCVTGDDGVSTQLDLAANGQHADGREIVLRHLAVVTRNSGCNMIYIADANPQIVAADLSAMQGAPILTITDADRSPGPQGIISLTILDNHVRFNIDEASASADGLSISSKLLSLAHNVRQKSAGAP